MSDSYILILLTILILLIIVVGYFIQKKIRQLELESNTMKCDIESHSDYVSNILNKQNELIYEIINDSANPNLESLRGSLQKVDFSKINDIMKEDKDCLIKQRDELSGNMSESSVDNELVSDYDISDGSSSDNISDDESISDNISIEEEIISNESDDSSSDNENSSIAENNNIFLEKSVYEPFDSAEVGESNVRTIQSVKESSLVSNNVESKSDSTTKSIKLNISKSSSTRKTPNNSANQYDIGHIMESENDNRMYKVIEMKNGVKRWVLNKN